MLKKPETNEYPPYYKEYVNNVPDGELLQILDDQQKETKELLKDLSEETAEYQYAPGKWTIKEVIGHITDTERIMCYRLLSIARGEKGMLPGYTDDDYVKRGQFNCFSLSDLLHHQALVRQHTILLLSSLDEEALRQRGNANGSKVTALAIAYIIAGHEIHHRRLIEERYLRDILENSDNNLR
ncbi:DinB family protein [Rossellomorea sp. LjRoot5]|uniref:DinB family protein n=1 Tax=Rossellomorea sp. LjRoot5 TaxID=3342331 RepID=UPI003ECECB31